VRTSVRICSCKFFLLRKWIKRIEKDIVRTLRIVENSWSPQLRYFMIDLALDTWREVGYSEGLHDREEYLIPWVVYVEGKESWWIGIVVGVRNMGIRLLCVDNE
jgi:hypothetical protein